MKALLLENRRQLSLREVETPTPKDDQVLVNIEVTSIGGSEYLGFNNPGIRQLPNIMGHGIVGSTEEGKRVAINPLKGCGRCSYCEQDMMQLCDHWKLIGVQSDGGFAQKIAVSKDSLYELPTEITWEQSAFIEPFSNSINAWERSSAGSRDSIGIVGAGSLGLGLTVCANHAHCTMIATSDLSDTRIAAAQYLGATETSISLAGKYDIVFDTVGSIESMNQAIGATQKGGKCVFLGFTTAMYEVNFVELIRFQKHFIGSFVYSKDQFRQALNLVKNCDSQWVKNLSFMEVEQQLVRFSNQDFSVVKAVLKPNP